MIILTEFPLTESPSVVVVRSVTLPSRDEAVDKLDALQMFRLLKGVSFDDAALTRRLLTTHRSALTTPRRHAANLAYIKAPERTAAELRDLLASSGVEEYYPLIGARPRSPLGEAIFSDVEGAVLNAILHVGPIVDVRPSVAIGDEKLLDAVDAVRGDESRVEWITEAVWLRVLEGSSMVTLGELPGPTLALSGHARRMDAMAEPPPGNAEVRPSRPGSDSGDDDSGPGDTRVSGPEDRRPRWMKRLAPYLDFIYSAGFRPLERWEPSGHHK